MVNYKSIADAASKYSGYETAYAAMSAETVDGLGNVSSNRLRGWCAANPLDYDRIKNSEGAIADIALIQIRTESAGLDLSEVSIQGFVMALPISPAGKAGIFALAKTESKVWRGLKPGHVQNAMQKRAAGVI